MFFKFIIFQVFTNIFYKKAKENIGIIRIPNNQQYYCIIDKTIFFNKFILTVTELLPF
jgi:hypothetical protein